MTRPADIYEGAKEYFELPWFMWPWSCIAFLFDMTFVMAIVFILNCFGIEEL